MGRCEGISTPLECITWSSTATFDVRWTSVHVTVCKVLHIGIQIRIVIHVYMHRFWNRRTHTIGCCQAYLCWGSENQYVFALCVCDETMNVTWGLGDIRCERKLMCVVSGIWVSWHVVWHSESRDTQFWVALEFQRHSILGDNGNWVIVDFETHMHPSVKVS
jgi:hypothetical protein